MQRKLLIPTALAATLALAACGEGITNAGTQNQLSRADAQALAGDFGDQDGAILDGMGGPAFSMSADAAAPLAALTVTTTFTRTRTCPGGGDVKLEGSVIRTWDRTTQTGSIAFNATRTEEACVFTRNGNTITVNGNPNTQLTANQSVTNGTPGVRTATKKGSFTWTRSNGGSGTCNIDVTHTWDPATHTLHVVGTVCNQTIDLTRTWTQT